MKQISNSRIQKSTRSKATQRLGGQTQAAEPTRQNGRFRDWPRGDCYSSSGLYPAAAVIS
jgi:hypothetical protein